MSSIKDVARRANVSISTVSLAFNQPSRVSPRTRAQIFAAAKALGFTLSNRREIALEANSILFVAPFFREMCVSVIRGAQDACAARNWQLLPLLAYGDVDSGMYAAVEAAIRNRRVAGIIFAGRLGRFENVASESGIPAVHCLIENCEKPSILVNNYKMGADMAAHLLKNGYRSIAIIGDRRHSRMLGFAETLARHGIELYDEGNWCDAVAQIETCSDAYGFMCEVISTQSNLPDAVFCMTDMAAFGVMSALGSYGLKTPEDIAVAGCEDVEMARLTAPPLTSMAIPRYEQGIQACNLLWNLIGGGAPERIVLDAKLVERDSTRRI